MQKLFLLSLVIIFSSTAMATGRISGYVKDFHTEAPLVGAKITLDGTSLSVLSDEKGFFEIAGIPPGVYSFRVVLAGYDVYQMKDIQVFAGANIPLQILLIKTSSSRS